MGIKNDDSGGSEDAAAVALMIASQGAAELARLAELAALAGWAEMGWGLWALGSMSRHNETENCFDCARVSGLAFGHRRTLFPGVI